MTYPTPARRPRRLRRVLTAVALLAIGLVVALPWLLSTRPVRVRVAAAINRAFAPGRVEFDSLSLSWTNPTRLAHFALFDPRGKAVVKSRAVTLDQNLFGLIFGGKGPAALFLESPAITIERSKAGVIDLVVALRSVIDNPDPMRDLIVSIKGGTLVYNDPLLAEPAWAHSVALTLRIPQAPHPLSWDLKLDQKAAALEIQGDFDRWRDAGGLRVGIVGKRWPISAKAGALDALGQLDGTIDLDRKRGSWTLAGDAKVLDFRLQGEPLRGDVLALDRLEAGWDVAEGEGGWSIRRLNLTSSLGEIKADGRLLGPGGVGKQRIDGRVDLAAVARMLPHALRLTDGLVVERGTAKLGVEIAAESARTTIGVEADLSDLRARSRGQSIGLKDPAKFSALLVREGGESRVERLSARTSFLDASANGRVEDGVTLGARVDLDGFRRQLGDWVDLDGFELAGRAQVVGTYRANAGRFEATAKADVRDIRVAGIGGSPVGRDLVTIDNTATGPAGATGLPTAWERWTANLKSGATTARLEGRRSGRVVAVSGAIGSPITLNDQTRTAEASCDGEWSLDGREFGFDRVALQILPRPEGRSDAPFALAARGKLDLDRGELVLTALPGDRGPAALTLLPDGLRVSGIGRGLAAVRVDGGLAGDLGALDRLASDWSGRAPSGLTGRWSAVATARGEPDGIEVAAKLGTDPGDSAAVRPERPESLSVRARYATEEDRLAISEFTVATRYGILDASGQVDDPAGARRVDLKGTVAPDFAALTSWMAARIEPGAKVEGRPRAFRLAGTLGGGAKGGLAGDVEGEAGFDLTGLDVYGMKLGSAPVVLRAAGGKVRFEPISTTLNEGHIRLEPEVDLDDPAGATLRLGKNSTIRDARINDEVSRRVLAFVAPILDQATTASGRVNVDLDHAEFPLGSGRREQLRVEGAVVFDEVEFAPGALAEQLLNAIGRRDARLRLDRPVTLTIADGRINQRGLSVPIGELTRIEMAGWVDFDRNLAITATLPVTPAMLGNVDLLADIAAGTSIKLPIGGTLDRPTLDKDAFQAGLKDMGKSLLTRGATRGAMELLMRLGRPADPNAPPPLTPEERRERRMERKAQKRERRNGVDPDNPGP